MDGDDDFTFCQVAPPADHSTGGTSITDNLPAAFGGGKNGTPLWKDKLEDGSVSAQQAVVGSLTFNVIDASSNSRASNSRKNATLGDGKVSVPQVEENESSSRKATPRAKVPFEKGYSPMDWLKLTRTHPDLAGILLSCC